MTQLLLDVSDEVATVTLNRPEARNALSSDLTNELDDVIVDLDQNPDVRAIILTGTDPAFSAGFDLRSLSTELREVREQRHAAPIAHLGMLAVHDTPVIGAINGPAVTGGLELALACDFLIASERARFADTHARVGAMPGGGMTIRLPELIGLNRARQMSLTGDFIDAQKALDWGLVNEVVPHEELMPRCRLLAQTIASIPAENVRHLRHMYAEIGDLVGHEAWKVEMDHSRRWMAGKIRCREVGRGTRVDH